jgi:hypothetical protein
LHKYEIDGPVWRALLGEFSRGMTDLITIRQFGNMSEALLAKGCLESAGIECFLADANVTRLEWPLSRGMRLQVSPDDAESAIEILASAQRGVSG